MKLVAECFAGSQWPVEIAGHRASVSAPPAHASTAEQPKVKNDRDKDKYQPLRGHCARIGALQIGVNDERKWKKNEAQKRNDDGLIDTVKEAGEEPEENDRDSRERNCEQSEETRHKSTGCILPSPTISRTAEAEREVTAAIASTATGRWQ